MRFESEHYYHAAIERLEQARALYRRDGSYALAMYTAGVATECMLRAFRLQRNPSFDERHDLLRLFQASGMLRLDEERMMARGTTASDAAQYARTLRVAVNEIHNSWNNSYRYASEQRLRAELVRLGLHLGIKGDVLKVNALRLLDSASTFIEKGVLLWEFLTKK